MKTLLKIQTSLLGSSGQSSQLADRFAAAWVEQNPGARVIERDLSQEQVPHLTAERFQSFATKAEDRTPGAPAGARFPQGLINGIPSADGNRLAVPMYNFS